MNRGGTRGALALVLIAGCRPAAEVHERPEPPPSSTSAIPAAWSGLGIPTARLVRVLPESNEHGFYADYSGSRELLLARIVDGLATAGYSRSCTALDGDVIGFSNGRRQLALKIDLLPEPYLSLFDEQGKEPLLHGLCFGRYREGPWRTLSQAEKEELARSLEEDEKATPAPSASP
jgi:hypothetical protein